MNYKVIYQDLINKAKSEKRKKSNSDYYEAHHIKPKSFGGEGDCRNINHPNIVLSTPKEHYIAHLLLTKIYPTSPAMHTALWNMININQNIRHTPSANTYKKLREEYIKFTIGETNPFYGKHHTNESKEKISLKAKGRQAWLGKKHTEKAKEKMRNFRLGKSISEEVKLKIKNSTFGGNHYNAKSIKCIKTNMIFKSGRELSEYLNKPFSTIRRYLNGRTNPPSWFHYVRI
jgi:hypothetical protein